MKSNQINKVFSELTRAFETYREEFSRKENLVSLELVEHNAIEITKGKRNELGQVETDVISGVIRPFCAVSFYITAKENQVVIRIV